MGQIPYARQWIDEEDVAAVAAVLRSDWLTQGPTVAAFEQRLCEVTGARHAVAVSSGTAALHLAALALDLGPGDVGVTSPITFAASSNALLYAGADAAFADVDPRTGVMALEGAEDRLRELARGGRKGVLIPVSYSGRVADLPGLQALAREHGWRVVEDAAHSLGGTYRATDGGTHASGSCAHTEMAILSFHPVKHVCCGEGGAVTTNEDGLAERLRSLRSHGIRRPNAPDSADPSAPGWLYEQTELGYNYRITDLQAALGISQLRRLPGFVDRRRALAARYTAAFSGAPFQGRMVLPGPDAGHAWHLYVVHFRDEAERTAAWAFLRARGIFTQVHYVPVYRHPYYERRYGEQRLAGAEAFYRGCLSLPLYPKLQDSEQDAVIAALAEFLMR